MATALPTEFAEARPVAQHCAELTWRGPRPEERADLIASWRRDLAQELALELGQLLARGKLKVAIGEPEMLAGEEVFERIGPVAANTLLRCGDSDQTVLLSLDYATAIALTDCSFGGEGEMPGEAPTTLPRSAAMLVEQLAATVAQVIALARSPLQQARGDVLVRSESVARLKPFSARTQVALFPIDLAMSAGARWQCWLAAASERLDSLLPGLATGEAQAGRRGRSGGLGAQAVAQMPLGLTAILAEFDLPLARLGSLRPGDEIPLSIPQEIALRTDDSDVAHGAVGSCDGRMALRLTRMAWPPNARGAAAASRSSDIARGT
ncbi:FliM/FliN family flagellar motor switch protein [Erythrobacter sp.]|jgi:flagellar motor switch protein FliM|uniref:FliM/FliN family flagellar motor switch protein n=1 Tax=Erythrobacter sp. TaxID=1042 RepID=UPI002E9D088C|nr:FliM/FliN family flagellar motor switch protein [Erythrobacter sp.]